MIRYSQKFSIGLTGGIGSGKTTVTDYFSKLGAGVIDADDVSRSLTMDHTSTVKILATTFGEQILQKPGVLDRDKLREIVFNDQAKKHQLERILHPLIRSEMKKLAQTSANSYLIFSIPLLIESGQQGSFDRILVIDTPDDLRIKWIKKRSNLDENQIQKIMNAQLSSSKRLIHADDVIHNNLTLAHLYAQVEKLHQRYLGLTNKSSN